MIELHEEDARRIDALDKNRIRSCMQPDKQGKVLVWTFDRLGWREEGVLQIEAKNLRWIWNYAGMTGVSSEVIDLFFSAVSVILVICRVGPADNPKGWSGDSCAACRGGWCTIAAERLEHLMTFRIFVKPSCQRSTLTLNTGAKVPIMGRPSS